MALDNNIEVLHNNATDTLLAAIERTPDSIEALFDEIGRGAMETPGATNYKIDYTRRSYDAPGKREWAVFLWIGDAIGVGSDEDPFEALGRARADARKVAMEKAIRARVEREVKEAVAADMATWGDDGSPAQIPERGVYQSEAEGEMPDPALDGASTASRSFVTLPNPDVNELPVKGDRNSGHPSREE